MNSAARSTIGSNAPLSSCSGDGGAALSFCLAAIAIAAQFFAVLLHSVVQVAISASLFLLAAIGGFYSVLFAIGALSNQTPRRGVAWFGMLLGVLPPLALSWLIAHAFET